MVRSYSALFMAPAPRRGCKGRRGHLRVSRKGEECCQAPASRVQQLLISSVLSTSSAFNNFKVRDGLVYLPVSFRVLSCM